MNKNPLFFLYLGLAVAIVATAWLVASRIRSNDRGVREDAPAVESASPAVAEHAPDTVASDEATRAPSAVLARPDGPVDENDMTPFLRSDIAEKWQRELGYTAAEILAAQEKIRAQRYPEETVNDPGVIMRHLPSRHVGRVVIDRIAVAATVKAGEPIPFTISGTAPSPSFRFTHFDVLVQGPVIRLQARGHADGETDSGLGGPVTLDGTIDPLPPGDYRIEVTEQGPSGSYPFTVVE